MRLNKEEKKLAFLLSTSPYIDTLDALYDKAARDLVANGVVPVVRCKDCALQGKLGCPMDEWVKPDDNGFCHHGKRKDGEC